MIRLFLVFEDGLQRVYPVNDFATANTGDMVTLTAIWQALGGQTVLIGGGHQPMAAMWAGE